MFNFPYFVTQCNQQLIANHKSYVGNIVKEFDCKSISQIVVIPHPHRYKSNNNRSASCLLHPIHHKHKP